MRCKYKFYYKTESNNTKILKIFMDKIWIALLSIIAGSLLTVLGKYFTAKYTSGAKKEISFRKTILKRIKQLENEQDELNKEVEKWTLRYWSLYRWIVNFCNRNNIDELPPDFHEAEKEEIKQINSKK